MLSGIARGVIRLAVRRTRGPQTRTPTRLPCCAVLLSRRCSVKMRVQQRALFDARPRGDGYTHFKSNKGHSDSGARVWYVIITCVPSSLLLYYAVHLDRAPYTKRIRMIDLPRDKELAMGQSQFRSLLARHPVLPAQHPASQLVQRVGTRIAAVADIDAAWEFCVVDSPMVS